MMKKLSVLMLLCTVCFTMIQCTKEGPAGEQGAAGNANVTQYTFNSFTHSGIEVEKTFDLSKADFDQSLLYVFANTGTSFNYPLPGIVSVIEYRIYYQNPTTANTKILINRVSGTGTQQMSLKIYVVKSTTSINAGRNASAEPTIIANGRTYTDAQLRNMNYAEFCQVMNVQ